MKADGNKPPASHPPNRLSRIETQWSIVNQAHNQELDAQDAVSILIDRYTPAIQRYLKACLRNDEAAEEVFQEFALKLINGSFKNARPEKGKFRNMIKTTLYRLIIDYHRRNQKKQHKVAELPVEQLPCEKNESDSDSFNLQWRTSLLEEAWIRLEQLQNNCSRPYFTVLKHRVDNPSLTTKALYQLIAEDCNDLPEESGFRVFLHRCRKRFAAILVEMVRESLDDPTDEAVECELIDLGLHHYVSLK